MQKGSYFLLLASFALLFAGIAEGLKKLDKRTVPKDGLGSAEFNRFVRNALESFRDHEVEDNVSFPDDLHLSIMSPTFFTEGTVWDFSFNGLRSMEVDSVYTTPDSGFISYYLEFPSGGNYSGSFSLSGTVGTRPLNGKGTWTLDPKYVVEIHVENHFEVVDGYVSIKPNSTYFSLDDLFEYGYNQTYVGLFDNSDIDEPTQERVKTEISAFLRRLFKNKVMATLKEQLNAQLQSHFDKVPYDEIMSGVTLPPPTPTPCLDIRCTTEWPCFSDLRSALEGWGYSYGGTHKDEVVISSQVKEESKDRIVMEVITKKTVVLSN